MSMSPATNFPFSAATGESQPQGTPRWWPVVAIIAATVATAAIGGLITAPRIPTWYATLPKPWFTPPNWLFAPVWTMLYIVMAATAIRVWLAHAPLHLRQTALLMFFVQLALNFLWTPAFFGLRNPGLGLAVIALLWMAILLTMRAFHAVRPWAAWAWLPYLAWVSYATALNAAIFSSI
ncbi:TspO/MBR family protein [Methyloraptor flagellatus]|uniref:TspO/MBR family protein n=1 Tax=Methyloraptor flagellatus TaxID=3162530 RepID=A0AAU7XBZ3_9HYPH